MELHLTEHAAKRYCERADPVASRGDIERVLLAGEYRTRWAGRVAHRTDGWVVVVGGAFPLERGPNGILVAKTFIPKTQRLKADRRAWREWQREERLAA